MSPAVVQELISTNPESNSSTLVSLFSERHTIIVNNEKVNNKKVPTTIKYEANRCIETIRPISVLQSSDRTQRKKKSLLRYYLLIQYQIL